MFLHVRTRSRGICAPYEDARGGGSGSRIEAAHRSSIYVVQSHVAGHVANRVGADLGRAEPVEETRREEIRDERDSATVVRIEVHLWSGARGDPLEPIGNRGDRDVP